MQEQPPYQESFDSVINQGSKKESATTALQQLQGWQAASHERMRWFEKRDAQLSRSILHHSICKFIGIGMMICIPPILLTLLYFFRFVHVATITAVCSSGWSSGLTLVLIGNRGMRRCENDKMHLTNQVVAETTSLSHAAMANMISTLTENYIKLSQIVPDAKTGRQSKKADG